MPGTELAYLIRELDKDIIILGITGYSKVLEELNVKEIGFDECFLKPVGYKLFFDYVRGLT
jgi:hypothetical protein